jgi:hypothetical protein
MNWKKPTPAERAERQRLLALAEERMGNRSEAEDDPEDVPRPQGEFWITHYYDLRHPENASSEFIRKKDVLFMNRTHGLGSGIYGVITGTHRGDRPAAQNGKVLYRMLNPLRIDEDDELAYFSALSIGLIEACELLVAAYANRDPEPANERLNRLVLDWSNDQPCHIFLNRKIVPALPDGSNIGMLLHNTVENWVRDYVGANDGDYLYQPINYLLMRQYDGVYNTSENGNTFATGSVYYHAVEHIPRAQDSAMTHNATLLPGNKLIPCNPVDLQMGFTGGKRKKSKGKRKSKKRR